MVSALPLLVPLMKKVYPITFLMSVFFLCMVMFAGMHFQRGSQRWSSDNGGSTQSINYAHVCLPTPFSPGSDQDRAKT